MKTAWTREHVENLHKAGKIRGYAVNGVDVSSKKKKSKYGNVKVEFDGYWFDSKKESRRYLELREKAKRFEISQLEVHAEFPLMVEGKLIATYVCDFKYRTSPDFILVVEDVKSAATRVIQKYRMKKKLMKAIYNIDITEV